MDIAGVRRVLDATRIEGTDCSWLCIRNVYKQRQAWEPDAESRPLPTSTRMRPQDEVGEGRRPPFHRFACG